jgi:acyl-CoA thioesterase-1
MPRTLARLLFALVPAVAILWLTAPADAASGTVVALGASNTYGKGVSRNQSYPAQLEAMLKAAGHSVRVINAGINGDTTAGMLARLSSAVPNGTKVVILQPGGNDGRKGSGSVTGTIREKLAARGIRVIMMENYEFRGLPHSDSQHLTPDGYGSLARRFVPKVLAALGG